MAGRGRESGRALATVFFTDIVGSTALAARIGDERWRQLLGAYHRTVRHAVQRGGGREVDSAGDGLFAVFDSPAAAIRCAGQLTDDLHRLGVEVRTGLHTGEVELMRGKVGGIAVHLGARVSAEAGPGEILVTSTVRDLVAGSGIDCVDRGVRPLKGIPGEWRIYAVDRPEAVPLDGEAVLERLGEAARGRSRRRLVVAAVGAVVVAVALVVVLLLTHRGPAAVASVVPEAGSVGHLDASAGAFTAAPRTGHEPSDVAVGAGAVWVDDYTDETLVQLDPTTGAVLSTRAVGGKPTGLCIGGGGIWVTTQFGLTAGVGGSVIRFDPVTNSIDRPIPVGDGVQAIAYQDNPGSVWVTNVNDDSLMRIDAASEGVVSTIDLHHQPTAIAVGAGAVWVGGADKALLRIDPTSNRIATTIQLRAVPTAIAVGDGAVWVASAAGNSVTRIDPGSGTVVTTIAVDGGPAGIAAADGAVWVTASTAGTVDRIDPQTNTIASRVSVHGVPHGVAAAGRDAWVTVSSS